jgi:hypothetical protein
MKTVRVRKLAAVLSIAMAISIFAATPAHASPSDAAEVVTCEAAYYFDYSYYTSYCEQSNS